MGEFIRDTANRWTAEAGRQAGALSDALRAAGDSFRDQGQIRLASWSRRAADDAARVSSYLEREDARGLLEDVEGVARRNPGVFIGLSLAAGVAVGRLLRVAEPSWTTDADEVRA